MVPPSVLVFDYALIAVRFSAGVVTLDSWIYSGCDVDDPGIQVRATNIVRDARQSGRLPPHPFPPIASLGSLVPRPDFQELKDVFNIQHMVRCIEGRLLRDLDYSQVELPYRKDELKGWRQIL
jgi:hypothetical protein